MATKIVLTVDEGLTQEEVDDLRYLLTDALGEFAARRTPARDYVEKRYVRTEADGVVVHTFGPKGTESKIEQVRRRCALARKLNLAAFGHQALDDKQLLFEQLLAHERAHHAYGTKPDLEGLTKALMELFS